MRKLGEMKEKQSRNRKIAIKRENRNLTIAALIIDTSYC